MALFGVLARTTLTSWTRAGLAWTLLALASLFAVVGLSQLHTHDMYFAPDVEVANAYTTFTRVTSLFHDPSIYGRHLAVAIAVTVVLLWFKRVRLAVAIPLIAFIWAGLFVSYSQSSMFALFVTVLVVSLLAADRRSRRILVSAAAVAAVAATVVVGVFAWNHSLRDITSGRSDLVANTARVVAAHPIVGVGIGGEARASREEGKKHGTLAKPSHTTPLTVAASSAPSASRCTSSSSGRRCSPSSGWPRTIDRLRSRSGRRSSSCSRTRSSTAGSSRIRSCGARSGSARPPWRR